MTIINTIKEAFNGTLSFLSSVDYSAVMVLFMIVLLGALIWNLNKKDNTFFNIEDLLIDEKKKASTTKLAILVALILSSWAFIHLTLNNALTEWYFMGYMGAWVLNKSINGWMEMRMHLDQINKTENKKEE